MMPVLFASPTTDLLLTGAILALVLMAAAILIALMGRWTKSTAHCDLTDPHEEMTRYRLMRDRGQISEEEFERVRLVMQSQIRKQLGDNPTQAELERAALWLTPISPESGAEGDISAAPPSDIIPSTDSKT